MCFLNFARFNTKLKYRVRFYRFIFLTVSMFVFCVVPFTLLIQSTGGDKAIKRSGTLGAPLKWVKLVDKFAPICSSLQNYNLGMYSQLCIFCQAMTNVTAVMVKTTSYGACEKWLCAVICCNDMTWRYCKCKFISIHFKICFDLKRFKVVSNLLLPQLLQ